MNVARDVAHKLGELAGGGRIRLPLRLHLHNVGDIPGANNQVRTPATWQYGLHLDADARHILEDALDLPGQVPFNIHNRLVIHNVCKYTLICKYVNGPWGWLPGLSPTWHDGLVATTQPFVHQIES